MVLDHISTRTYSSEPNSVLNKLLNHIKTIGGRVMGSAYSHAALRTRNHALIFNLGLPSIFLTLNPADIHSPVALYFAVANTWSTPSRLTRDNIYAAISTMDLSGFKQNIYESGILSTSMKELSSSSIFHASPSANILLQTPTHDRLKSVTNASHNVSKLIPAWLPTPNPSSLNFAAQFRADVVQLVEANNIHKHSDTCLDNRS
ncbi:unnamed protein product [Rotaria socialis]|uniref:Helitron helicase-like domain-containing protein n=1 Tax=Rotaria socialis TaxID=392032 RepID=A0A821VHG5_9BILA|nr:unnamed protein product [Rotaria socialis]